ncbi:MAG: hypothetical protein HY514_02665 [Candidatus Aenigmarchaeota archaeon]|nr:hypothetical protein [Candidatus Aenigmarchaeota archaeon]
MAFGSHVPIDNVCILLAGLQLKKYCLLFVDEFLRFNGVPEEEVKIGLNLTQQTMSKLSDLYGFRPEIIKCSDFMRSTEYTKVVAEIKDKASEERVKQKLLETVPQRYRMQQNALHYPMSEIACVEFLRKTCGMQVKLGPSKEKAYDEIMKDLGIDMKFAYLIDAYSFGSAVPEKVVHYVPTDRGKTYGQRLFIGDPMHLLKTKLLMGPEEASRYMLRVASVAGKRLGKNFMTDNEITYSRGRVLKKRASRLALENITIPYKEAAGHD